MINEFCFTILRESTVWTTRDAQWAPDDQGTHCRLCEKEFNLSRRKVFTCQSYIPIVAWSIYNTDYIQY